MSPVRFVPSNTERHEVEGRDRRGDEPGPVLRGLAARGVGARAGSVRPQRAGTAARDASCGPS